MGFVTGERHCPVFSVVPQSLYPSTLATSCSARRQDRWFAERFPEDRLLFQVGAYSECYDPPGELPALLALKPLTANRRGARYGVPVRLEGACLARLLAAGRSALVVRQGEGVWTGVRERQIAWRVAPPGALRGSESRVAVAPSRALMR
jgi:hypothetical protein